MDNFIYIVELSHSYFVIFKRCSSEVIGIMSSLTKVWDLFSNLSMKW